MNAEVLTLVPNAAVLTPLARTVSGLSICIPVYNEEGAVAETLQRCLAIRDALDRCGVPDLEIIAVDDGSRDGTAAIIARHPEVRLIRHETNRGYGAALKTGFAAARHDLIGFLDADATYPPEHFPQLCMAALGAGGELVIGTRMVGPDTDMPTMRRVGNSFFARLLTLIGRTPVTDTASGMRVFHRHVLELLSPLPDGLNLTPVMSTRAVHERVAVVEVPIPYHERVGESKLSVTRDGMRFLGTIISTTLAYNPVRVFGLIGLAGMGLAMAVLAGLMLARVNGVTTLGLWGTLAVFVALVAGVSGVSLFALGATFNYVVSLFYNRPIRQGLFKRPLIEIPVEQLFLPAGAVMVVLGVGVSAASLVLASRGWPIERLWLYLTSSAMAILIGFQLGFWWLMASVLRELSKSVLKGRPGTP